MHHSRGDFFKGSNPVRTFAFIIGTRPEVIKVAPIIRRLQNTDWAIVRIVTSGQQSDLLESTLAEFGLKPDVAIRHKRNCHTPALLASYLFDGWIILSVRFSPTAFLHKATQRRLMRPRLPRSTARSRSST